MSQAQHSDVESEAQDQGQSQGKGSREEAEGSAQQLAPQSLCQVPGHGTAPLLLLSPCHRGTSVFTEKWPAVVTQLGLLSYPLPQLFAQI